MILFVTSTIFITLALIFYSTGIWAERIARYLRRWHVVTFWAGFVCDVTGTFLMHLMARGKFDILDLHTLTGQIALWLMLAHAIWATVVVKRNHVSVREKFHRYSIFVWLIWLVPYFGGMIMAMN